VNSTAITSRKAERSPSLREQWWSNPRADLLAGLVVALALIPEAISFSIIVGVDPKVGLYASFTMAVVTAVVGGRPALISAATGSMALVMATLVKDHGIQYLYATAIATGFVQLGLGVLGVGRLMRFIPRSVMTGFVNALAILIFIAQIRNVWGDGALAYVLVVAAIAFIYLFPRLTDVVPAPLIAIVLMTVAAATFHWSVPTVGDRGELPSSFPSLLIPDIPWTFETLQIIAPYAVTLALVGLLESLLTAQLLDDLTDTNSDKDRESRGQGIANVVTGLFGGMAGCALVGQSMMNIRYGARTRLSTLASGVFLLALLLVGGPVVAKIPMSALVAVMIVVCVATFDWSSITPRLLKRTPRSETAVMVVTVAIVVATDNLAIGVVAGVLLAAVFFARRVAHLVEISEVSQPDPETRRYALSGELFFASTNELVHAFDYVDSPAHVIIDLSEAHVWDGSAVAALDSVVAKFERHGVTAEIVGLNVESSALHSRLSGHFGSQA